MILNIYLVGMIISMVIYIVLGLVISSKVKDTNDFFVAGRQAPTVLIVGSLVASYCSTGLFMGDVGEAYGGFFTPFMMTAMMLVGGVLGRCCLFRKVFKKK